MIVFAGVLGFGAILLTKDNIGNPAAVNVAAEPLIDLTSQSEVSMDIKDFKYAKASIKIKKGTTVTWVNRDVMEHNVMHSHEGEHEAHSATAEDEVEEGVLASPLLKKGGSYSFTFDEAGTFRYHCSPHPYMTGSVTVVDNL